MFIQTQSRLNLKLKYSIKHFSTKHYFVTTPIFYVNANPHIGHLHSTLLADVYTRYAALKHPSLPPILCTGTDEHGLKIQRVAQEKGIPPGELCDSVSLRFKELAKAAGIDYTIFMRTTEERHKLAVQHIWKELDSKGCIYKDSYAGWYAVSDEAYYTEAQVMAIIDEKTGEQVMVSIETGTKVEWMEEETYKFRLSAFKEPLIAWLSTSPSVLQPPSRATSLLASLNSDNTSDFNDLSISRPSSRLTWGIKVPNDENQTIYVWIDALVNYLTASGYPWSDTGVKETSIWPPDLMVIGKDIIRFHAIYLPSILIALSLPLPQTILAHGHWTMDKFKMSKSRGNVVDPFELMNTWGRDAVRCWLMRVGGNPGNDADYSTASISAFYRKDLVGQLGNLISRISAPSLISKLDHPEQISIMPEILGPTDLVLVEKLNNLPEQVEAYFRLNAPHKVLSAVFALLADSNAHLQALSPWSTLLPVTSAPFPQTQIATPSTTSTSTSTGFESGSESIHARNNRVHRALFFARESLRISAILLQPFMPEKMDILLDRLGVALDQRRLAGLAFDDGLVEEGLDGRGQGAEWIRVGKGSRSKLINDRQKEILFPFVVQAVEGEGLKVKPKRSKRLGKKERELIKKSES